MASSAPKVILLTTLYRSKDRKTEEMLLVTSYKIDPRGEEFLAAFQQQAKFELSSTLVNRVVFYQGAGTFIPLINSRVLFDTVKKITVYAGVYTPHPFSNDYKNPYTGGSTTSSIARRISVCTIDAASGPVGYRGFAEEDMGDLKDLFQAEPEKLARRIKSVTIKEDKPNPIKRKDMKSKETSAEYLKTLTPEALEQSSLKQVKERANNRVMEKHALSAPISRSLEQRENKTDEDKIDMIITRCRSLCIQHSAIYEIADVQIDRDVEKAKNLLRDTGNIMSNDYIDKLKIEGVGGANAIAVSKDKNIIGYVEVMPRKSGVMLNEGLAVVLFEGSGI